MLLAMESRLIDSSLGLTPVVLNLVSENEDIFALSIIPEH